MNTQGSVDRRSGQVVILFLFVMTVILGFAMFTVDLGHIVVTDSRLQNSVDAATLAAGQVLLEQYTAGTDEAQARSTASSEAALIQSLNASGGRVEIVFGIRSTTGAFVPVDTGQHATAVRGIAFRDDNAPEGPCSLFFAPTMGISDVDMACTALIQIEANINVVHRGMGPFAVPETAVPEVGYEMIFYPGAPSDETAADTSGHGHDMFVGGNWGLLDLANSGGVPGTSDVADWILNGYNEGLEIPEGGLWMDGTPGLRAALKTPMKMKLGEQMILAVFDEVILDGGNARYHLTGFLVVTITHVDLTGNDKQLRARVDGFTNIADTGTGSTTTWSGSNLRKIHLAE